MMLNDQNKRALAQERQRLIVSRIALDKKIAAIDFLLGNTAGLAAHVRKAITAAPNTFSVRNVLTYLRGIIVNIDERRREVGSILFKIAKAEDFEVLERGRGRKPTIYRRPGQ